MDNETFQMLWNLKYVIGFAAAVLVAGCYFAGKDER